MEDEIVAAVVEELMLEDRLRELAAVAAAEGATSDGTGVPRFISSIEDPAERRAVTLAWQAYEEREKVAAFTGDPAEIAAANAAHDRYRGVFDAFEDAATDRVDRIREEQEARQTRHDEYATTVEASGPTEAGTRDDSERAAAMDEVNAREAVGESGLNLVRLEPGNDALRDGGRLPVSEDGGRTVREREAVPATAERRPAEPDTAAYVQPGDPATLLTPEQGAVMDEHVATFPELPDPARVEEVEARFAERETSGGREAEAPEAEDWLDEIVDEVLAEGRTARDRDRSRGHELGD